MAVVAGVGNEGWVNDGGDDGAAGKCAGAGNGDAGMLFGLGSNSRCDGAWVQIGLFGLPMVGFWAMTGNDVGKFPATAD